MSLIRGAGGIFEVRVDGAVVSKKTLAGFPENDAIIEAVGAATSAQ